MRHRRLIGTCESQVNRHGDARAARIRACRRSTLVVPLSSDNLLGQDPTSRAEEVVVYDELGAGPGLAIALSEGGEAAQPFYPEVKPIDAYNAAILDILPLIYQRFETVGWAERSESHRSSWWDSLHSAHPTSEKPFPMLNIHKIKKRSAKSADRIYNKGFAAANDGNITYPHQRERSRLHAHDDLQRLHEARRSVHRRHGRQAACRQAGSGRAKSCCTWRS